MAALRRGMDHLPDLNYVRILARFVARVKFHDLVGPLSSSIVGIRRKPSINIEADHGRKFD